MLPLWVGDYIGIAFRTCGRERGSGLDCWGLIRHVYAEQYGILLPCFADHYNDVKRDYKEIHKALVHVSGEILVPITERKETIGDTVLLNYGGLPLHVALYVGWEGGERWILHTTQDRGHSHLARLDSKEFEHANPRFYCHPDLY